MTRDPVETSEHHVQAHETPRDVLEAFAQAHFGLPIDAPTHERWGHAIPLMQRIDALVAARNFVPEQAFKNFFDSKSYAKKYPSLKPAALGAERYSKFTEHIGAILDLGDFASQTVLVEQYVEAREVQAYEAVEALGCIASNELRNNPVFTGHYLPALTHLATITTLRDSMRDSVNNHRRGKLGFPPGRHHDYTMTDAASRHNDGVSGVLLRVSTPIAIAQPSIDAHQYPDVRLLGT